ncbi:alpha/beta fold hydrolase [Kineococcus gynurae]|uniref:Alpha/beta fold hydrolase n=1 Tax=Kineococcus gynurae TaxID=452979 RepID=A0ABV5LSM4_9ACTN
MSTPDTLDTTTTRLDGHTAHAHRLTVPVDRGDPTQGEITVFAREVVRDGGEDRPRLLFLQGGPGNPSPRPDTISGWLDRALEDYRVVLLDQRGTGLSSPQDAQSLAGLTPVEQADRLSRFRADAIVADAEALREALGIDRWSLLGQSYGGFCAVTYLSRSPGSLREVFITAGLPGLTNGPDEVYRRTYAQTARRHAEFYARYPDDAALAARIAEHLAGEDERLPTGERLSPRRFRRLGTLLGTTSRFDGLHHLLEDPFTTVGGERRLRSGFLQDVGAELSGARHPLYDVLHESIYVLGPTTGPSAWSAERVRAEFPEFALDSTGEFRFTAEHVYPWQFEEDPALTPLAEAAELLAHRDLGPLYDVEALAANEVPVAAAVYVDDLYVPYDLSVETARRIRGTRTFVTNEYHHDGLRLDGRRLLDRLVELARR